MQKKKFKNVKNVDGQGLATINQLLTVYLILESYKHWTERTPRPANLFPHKCTLSEDSPTPSIEFCWDGHLPLGQTGPVRYIVDVTEKSLQNAQRLSTLRSNATACRNTDVAFCTTQLMQSLPFHLPNRITLRLMEKGTANVWNRHDRVKGTHGLEGERRGKWLAFIWWTDSQHSFTLLHIAEMLSFGLPW